MQQLRETHRCRDILRMGPDAFLQLCEKLRATCQVRDTKYVTVEEQVARFLYIIAHNVKTRTVSFFYHRSGETVSRHFHAVLRAIILLEDEFLRQPSASIVSPAILHNHRFYPYFKDCIGAIDGTHFRVKVPIADQPKFRGRKDWPTQNVLAACDFDMKFTYVLTGWEGTASDSKVLKNALSRDDNLKLPRGKFYLGDAGFMLKHGLITPYRSVRYHLKEYARRGPENEKELFNLRHASLRNVIKRSFGVLKKRFAIITSGTEPHYDFETMTEIVLACCILHNFLMGVDPDPHLIAQVNRELQENNPEEDEVVRHEQDEDYRRGAILRDEIAAQMWADYQLGL
nr:putative nuclease HARBI1 [Arachis hypogaea]